LNSAPFHEHAESANMLRDPEEKMRKPTRTELLDVIADIEAGAWIDPGGEEALFWYCDLFDPNGAWAGEGAGYAPGEAMSYSWVHAHSPDALIENDVGNIPLEIADGWRFELSRSGEQRRPRPH
jgi:hypothetical protein